MQRKLLPRLPSLNGCARCFGAAPRLVHPSPSGRPQFFGEATSGLIRKKQPHITAAMSTHLRFVYGHFSSGQLRIGLFSSSSNPLSHVVGRGSFTESLQSAQCCIYLLPFLQVFSA